MEPTVSCLLMLQKHINSKHKTLKENIMHCVSVKFQKILQIIILKKQDEKEL